MSIFLSYSHHDDKDPEKWVANFHEKLKSRLETLTGEGIQILLDRYDLSGNLLNEGIEEMLEKAQFLIALVSPSYLKKEWCTTERSLFLESIKKRSPNFIVPEERIIVAIKLIEFGFKMVNGDFINILPSPLQKQRYFKFFSLDKNENPITLHPEDYDFNIEINDLAHKLVLFLQRAQDLGDRQKKCIFLAETTRDLESKRKTLTKELESSGYIVYPQNLLPDNVSEIEKDINFYLSKSLLSIHLIGNNYGFSLPDEEGSSLTKFQSDIAAKSDIPMLTWIASNLAIIDENQRTFVDDLKNNLTPSNDFIESSFEEFKIDLFERLKNLQK